MYITSFMLKYYSLMMDDWMKYVANEKSQLFWTEPC